MQTATTSDTAEWSLRTIVERYSIIDTKSLVEAFNAEAYKETKAALREWLKAYISCFAAKCEDDLSDSIIHEYCTLARVSGKDLEDKEIWNSFLTTLKDRLYFGNKGGKRDMKPLVRILDEIQYRMKETSLSSLLLKLLFKAACVNSRRRSYANVAGLGELLVWYKTLLILQQTEPPDMTTTLFTNFRNGIADVESKREISVTYRVQLMTVRASLELFTADIQSSSLISKYNIDLFLYLYRDVVDGSRFYVDLDDIEDGCREIKDQLSSDSAESVLWYDMLLALAGASLISLRRSDDTFFDFYEVLLSHQRQMKDRKERVAVQFVMLEQLLKIGMTFSIPEARKHSMDCFQFLARKSFSEKGWGHCPDAFLMLLDALKILGSKEEHRSAVIDMFNRLYERTKYNVHVSPKQQLLDESKLLVRFQSRFEYWMMGRTPEEVLSGAKYEDNACDLFSTIKSSLLHNDNDNDTQPDPGEEKMPKSTRTERSSGWMRMLLGQTTMTGFEEMLLRQLQEDHPKVRLQPIYDKRPEGGNYAGDYDKCLYEVGIRNDIWNTETLVEAYNREEHGLAREAMSDWLQFYKPWFKDNGYSYMDKLIVVEFAELTKIKPKITSDMELLSDVYCTLGELVRTENYGTEYLIRSVVAATNNIDERAFEIERTILLRLIAALVDKFSSFYYIARSTYKSQKSIIFAMHAAATVAVELCPTILAQSEVDQAYESVLTTIAEIVKHSHYYPYDFHCRMVTECLKRQKKGHTSSGNNKTLSLACRRLAARCVHFYGTEELANGMNNRESLKRVCVSFIDANKETLAKWATWYDIVQVLSATTLITMSERDTFELFEECVAISFTAATASRNKDNVLALRYAPIRLLAILASRGETEDIRNVAGSMLIKWGTTYIIEQNWLEDETLREAYFDALHSTNKARICQEEIRSMFETLATRKNDAVEMWLDRYTLDEKLTVESYSDDYREKNKLYETSRRNAGAVISRGLIHSHMNDLRTRYGRTHFADASSLFFGDHEKHVKDLEVEVGYRNDFSTDGNRAEDTTEYTRISVDDLFKTRGEQEVFRVFIRGYPGSGKTTLAKKLAYDWETGKWGKEFERVYYLEMLTLNWRSYNDIALRTKRALSTAICNQCYSRVNRDDDFVVLLAQIEQDLDLETTVVIFDGLDYCEDEGKQFMKQIEQNRCRVITLSRPLDKEYAHVNADLELECLGASDEFLEKYFRNELRGRRGRYYTERVMQNPPIWELAHTPILAHIICFSYKELLYRERPVENEIDLFSMVFRLFISLFDRFGKKYRQPNLNRNDVSDAIEKVAARGLIDGPARVTEEFLRICADSRRDVMDALKNSGVLYLDSGFYRFCHKSFEQFFIGKYLCRCISKKTEGSVEEVFEFLGKSKYLPRFASTIEFMAQSAFSDRGGSGLDKVFAALDEGPVEAVGWQQILLKIKLSEASFAAEGGFKSYLVSNDNQIYEVIRSARKIFDIMAKNKSRYAQYLAYKIAEPLGECKHLMSSYEYIIQPFIDQLKGFDWKRRLESFEVVLEFAKYSEHTAFQMSELLRDVCLHEEWNAREGAVETLRSAISKSSEFADALFKIEEKIIQDERSDVRRASVEAIQTLVEMRPRRSDDALRIVRRVYLDKRWMVRSAVMQAFGHVARSDSSKAKTVLTLVRGMSRDSECDVRVNAIKTLCIVGQVAPDCSRDIFALGIMICSDKDSRVRILATQVLRTVIESAPERALDVLSHVKKLLEDHDAEVRLAAITLVGDITATTTWWDGVAINIAFGMLGDEVLSVSRMAMTTISTSVRKIPEHIDEAMNKISTSYQDRDQLKRLMSMLALQAVVETSSDVVSAALACIQTVDAECDPDVRSAAAETMRLIVERFPNYSRQVYEVLERMLLAPIGDELVGVFKALRTLVLVDASYAKDTVEIACQLLDVSLSLQNSDALDTEMLDSDGVIRGTDASALSLTAVDCWPVRKTILETVALALTVAPELAARGLELVACMASDSAWQVRRAVVDALEAIVKTANGLEEAVLGVVTVLYRDVNWRVAAATINVLQTLTAASPLYKEAAVEHLARLCVEGDSRVLEIVATKLYDFARNLGCLSGPLIEIAKTLLVADEVTVHLAVLRSFSYSEWDASARSTLFDLTLKQCESEDDQVKLVAAEAAVDIALMFPSPDVSMLVLPIQVITAVSFRAHRRFQNAIRNAVQKASGGLQLTLEFALKSCEVLDFATAKAVIFDAIARFPSFFGENVHGFDNIIQLWHQTKSPSLSAKLCRAMKSSKEFADEVCKLMSRLVAEDSDVRLFAIELFGQILSEASNYKDIALNVAKNALSFQDVVVKEVGLKVLCNILLVCPGHAKQIVSYLKNASRDTDKRTRKICVDALHTIASKSTKRIKATAQCANKEEHNTSVSSSSPIPKKQPVPNSEEIQTCELFAIARRLCEDEDSFIRTKALDVIESLPTQDAIASALENTNASRNALLAHKMLRQPICFEKLPDNKTYRIVAYSAQGTETEFNISEKQSRQVLNRVHGYLDDEFPGILKSTRSEETPARTRSLGERITGFLFK